MTASTATVPTPDGLFTVVVADSIVLPDSVVLASGWTDDVPALVALIHPSLRPVSVEPVGLDDARVVVATRAVTAYYDGDGAAIDAVPVRQVSGPFRTHAWDTLRTVRPGCPVTYAEYAALAGRPRAVRAAGSACALNAAALFVPCHRVLRTDGSLGGFRYGLAVKQSLLDREAAFALTAGTAPRVSTR